MKLTAILTIALVVQAVAETYAQKITLNVRNATLQEVMDKIQQQQGYSFFFLGNQIATTRINVDVRQMELADAMDVMLTKKGLDWHIEDKTIVIKRSIKRPAQVEVSTSMESNLQQTISGRVTDRDGNPLAGVTVMAMEAATTTDANGRYTVATTQEDKTLSFTMIGFKRSELPIAGKTTIDVSLEAEVSDLDEVVVVGYGTQKKRDVTGSVASVSSERLEMVPNIDISQAIQGSVSGVVIQQSSGGSSPSSEIMIRGRNSILANNDPLIILDGVPYSGQLSDINVNDVSSIEVLKDASSAAIYGSRGANGVILVTTKKGVSGKATLSYDGKYSIQRPNMLPRFMTAEEFYEFKEIREPGKVTASEQAIYNDKTWVDWADLALRDGNSQQHNLSVSGLQNKTKYYVSGNFLNVNGQTINDSYRRITSRVNFETGVLDWIKLGSNTQISYEKNGGSPISWEDILRTNPLTKAYDDLGELTIYPWPEYTDISNPLEPINYNFFDKSFQVVSNNYVNVEVPYIEGLNYRLNSGVRKRFGDMGTYRGRNTSVGFQSRGAANTDRSLEDNIVFENILTYTKNINKHNFFLTALYSYEENSGSSNLLEATGFPHDFLDWYAVGQADFVLPSYTFTRTVLISQMLRFNYSYDSKYLLTLTGRRDGYSGFGEDNKWGFFPSVALGWNIDKEPFFPLKDIVDELKIRASLGLNGNQAVGAYESISRLSEQNAVSLGASLPGYVPSKIGQNSLGWETSRTMNVGLDFSMFSGILSGDLNMYNTNTADLLLNRTISPVHGITSITQNIGKTNNRGVEFSLNSKIISNDNFNWMASGNVSFNKNKIISLYGELDEQGNEIDDVVNAWFIGRPILINYDYKFDGVWQLDEVEEAALWDALPGYAKTRDLDGDKTRSAGDRMIIGQRDPKMTWGFNNTFGYKNFSLSVFMHGVHGITKQNALLQDASASSEVRRNVIKKNWWTSDNPTNEFYMNAVNVQAVSIYENASFIRIKDITLFYNFPERISKTLGLNRLRLYTVGRNLFTFTNWSASDPELNFGRGSAPLAKEFVFGLNIDF